MSEIEKGQLQFKLSRTLLGLLTLVFTLFLYGEYLRFLIDAQFTVPFRVVVFLIGQLVCFILFSWAGVLIAKEITCPKCSEGQLVFPITDLHTFLPSLPFSPKFLHNFSFNNQVGYILNSEDGKLKGCCQCCGAEFECGSTRENL